MRATTIFFVFIYENLGIGGVKKMVKEGKVDEIHHLSLLNPIVTTCDSFPEPQFFD